MSSNENLILFYITVASEKEGKGIALALLKKKLIACANILPAHTALYEWNGQIEESSEHVLILKCPTPHGDEVEKVVSNLHSYDCPCILRLSAQANLPFWRWAQDQTIDIP